MNIPILSEITFLQLIGSLFILLIKSDSDEYTNNAKYVAIFTSFVNLLLAIFLWFSFDVTTAEFQFVENRQWLKGYFNFSLGVDGISIKSHGSSNPYAFSYAIERCYEYIKNDINSKIRNQLNNL